jgi:hypothetical protein
MPRILLMLVALFSFLLCGCERPVSSNSPSLRSTPVQVIGAEFGLFNTENGVTVFKPSKKVPMSLEQSYGWVVTLKTSQSKVKWREEFTLPSAPEIWGKPPEGTQTLSKDRTVSVTERVVEPNHGVITNMWSVADSDPKGKYVIRLTVENVDPIVFEFEVE